MIRARKWSRALLNLQRAVVAADGDNVAIMDAVVRGALDVMPQAAGAIVEMLDLDERECRAASGIFQSALSYRRRLSGSLLEQCLASGQPHICADTETSPLIDPVRCREFGVRSIIVVPIPFEGRNIGGLTIVAAQPGLFDDEDLLVAQLLVGSIATGLTTMARAHAHRAHSSLHRRFEATFEQAAVGMAHVSPDGSFLLVNDRFCRIAGHSRTALISGGFQQITHPDDLNADMGNVQRLLDGSASSYAMEKRYVRADGSVLWVNLTVSLVRTETGDPDFFVAVIEDIDSRKRAEEQALRDALTGLPNRRWLVGELGAHLAEAAAPLVVAYLDLDGFKSVNDHFGHLEGDRCLIDVAACLEQVLRPTDTVCRIAGDEFVILMRGTDKQRALKLMAEIRAAIAELCSARAWTIRASVGAVVLQADETATVEEVLAAADRLMYESKHAGQAAPIMRRLGEVLAA